MWLSFSRHCLSGCIANMAFLYTLFTSPCVCTSLMSTGCHDPGGATSCSENNKARRPLPLRQVSTRFRIVASSSCGASPMKSNPSGNAELRPVWLVWVGAFGAARTPGAGVAGAGAGAGARAGFGAGAAGVFPPLMSPSKSVKTMSLAVGVGWAGAFAGAAAGAHFSGADG